MLIKPFRKLLRRSGFRNCASPVANTADKMAHDNIRSEDSEQRPRAAAVGKEKGKGL
jgi:hypothetical protein